MIKRSQKKLKSGDNLVHLDVTTLRYSKKPIGRAIYKAHVGRPRKAETEKAKPTDRVKCHVCGKTIIRSGRGQHNNTKYHKLYTEVEVKLRKILIDD